jgi:hypothetical protein
MRVTSCFRLSVSEEAATGTVFATERNNKVKVNGALMNPDDRPHDACDIEARDAGLDDTLEQTFPASDPPSSIPNPCEPERLEEQSIRKPDGEEGVRGERRSESAE